MLRNSRSFYGTNRTDCRHEQTTPLSHDSSRTQSSQPRRRRLQPGTFQQSLQSESNMPVSALQERNRQERRSTSTGVRVYEPGMLLHDNPGASISCQTDLELGPDFRSESDQENSMSPSFRRISSPLFSTPLSEETTDLRALLQQQQGVVMRILSDQAAMEKKYAELEAKLRNIEEKVSTPAPVSSDCQTSSGGKRKRVISRDLTVGFEAISCCIYILNLFSTTLE